ncbi:divergent protein kinase domain 2B isoform X2 [Esox lucius]|uniref:divergent protein kinase domain 2B isoform X2 n=1 Tax=Esox lucius TaxID=8010 RepID=UPI001476BE81|nr:divergent protein kinase domain 2B isoform X2 [Esox lucius]
MLNREGRKQRTERTCKCFRDTRTRVRGPISRSTPAMPPTRPDRRAAGRAERLRLTVCVWWVWWAPAVGRVAGAPPPAPQQSDLSLRRAFLGLDKCNACVGTSVCKKLFRNQIMFDWWISPHAAATAALAQKQSFMANLTDDSSSWRLVALSFLSSPDLHAPSDRSICRSAGRQSPCSIEVVLKATRRFKSLNQSHILLPHMVEGLRTPLLRCPSQRLLDRIVRRYAEVVDVGSVQMKHFSERDKLRLLHTLAINQQPLMLQMFPGTEGWPFPRYQGSCGRLMVWASSRPLWGLYGSSEEFFQRVDVAYQLLQITQGLGHNSLGFQIYYTRLEEDMFGLLDDQRVFISDASSLGVIDLEQGPTNPLLFQRGQFTETCCETMGFPLTPPPTQALERTSSPAWVRVCPPVIAPLPVAPSDPPRASRCSARSSCPDCCSPPVRRGRERQPGYPKMCP